MKPRPKLCIVIIITTTISYLFPAAARARADGGRETIVCMGNLNRSLVYDSNSERCCRGSTQEVQL